MIVTQSGKISGNFYVAGPSIAPIYLLDGDTPVLFDGGFTAFSYLYEAGLKEILGNRSPAHLFITHSHFDHIGAIGHLKRAWPDLHIHASQKCRDVLSRSSAVELMKKLTRESTRNFQGLSFAPLYEEEFEAFGIDALVRANEIVAVSPGVSVIPFNTPGHTWDFMSYYIPEKKILIASESVAVYEGNGDVQTEFLVDIDAYLKSLEIMKSLDIEVLCAGHYAVFTGDDALRHIDRSIEVTLNFKRMAEKFLIAENRDVDRAAGKIRDTDWRDRPMPKQSEAAYMINTRQRVSVVLKHMGQD